MTRIRYRTPIKYRSSVDPNARDHDLHHQRTPSTLGGAPMGGGRGHDRHPQNGYDIVSALQGTIRAPSTSVRSGRRTGSTTINRTAIEDALDGEVHPLYTLPHREVLVPLRVVAPGLETGPGRCTAFRQRRMSVILTLRCRCLKLLPRGITPRKACAVDETKAPVRKLRLVPNPRAALPVFLTFHLTQAG